jgi:hypothetical protein
VGLRGGVGRVPQPRLPQFWVLCPPLPPISLDGCTGPVHMAALTHTPGPPQSKYGQGLLSTPWPFQCTRGQHVPALHLSDQEAHPGPNGQGPCSIQTRSGLAQSNGLPTSCPWANGL